MSVFPRELFEDSDDELMDQASIDRLYEYTDVAGLPGNLVYALVDPDRKIVAGILWFIVDPIFSALNCRLIAVLPEYRDGNVAALATQTMHEQARASGLTRLLGATRYLSGNWRRLGWEPLESQVIYQPVSKEE